MNIVLGNYFKKYFKTNKNNANSIKDEYRKTVPGKNGIQRISEKVISGITTQL